MGGDLEISYEKQDRFSFGSVVNKVYCILHDVNLV